MEDVRQIDLLCIKVRDYYNNLEQGSDWDYEIHPDSERKPYYITFYNKGSGLIFHRNFYRFSYGWDTPTHMSGLSDPERKLIDYLNSTLANQ